MGRFSGYDTPILLRDSAVAVAIITSVYCIGLAFYRLVLSPLSKFPGPKIAAITGYYEFYHDYFRHGKYVFEIKKMHDKYGPIVRINPHELSIHDPVFYNELYVTGSVRRTNNYAHFARGVEFDGTHFLSTDHDLHRRRRKPLDPFFSRLGVTRLESMVAELAGMFVRRLEGLSGSKEIVRLDHAFVAFSGDVISGLCCDNQSNWIEDPKYGVDWYNLLHDFIHSVPLVTAFPGLLKIAKLIPGPLLSWLDPRLKTFDNFRELARKHIIDAMNDKKKAEDDKTTFNPRNSVLRHILTSDLPEHDLTVERLIREAQVLLGAGSVSTARTLDFITYYILADNSIRSRLQDELAPLMIDYPARMPTWAELEKLPYLQAVIKEGLREGIPNWSYRLSYGIMHRLPRVSPDVPIKYGEWVIPSGIPVGMSAYMMHIDECVYPDPFTFNPDRWLGEIPATMNRYLVPFSRGSRDCLGKNLAHAELNIMLGILFRPDGPHLQLYETDETDIIQAHDFLIPLPKLDSKGLRITVR